MVPTTIVTLDGLPLTANGKVDRAALPDPEVGRSSGSGTGPRSPLEEVVTDLWCSLLGLDGLGVDDDVFELGADSLIAAKAASRLRREFDVELLDPNHLRSAHGRGDRHRSSLRVGRRSRRRRAVMTSGGRRLRIDGGCRRQSCPNP